MRRIALAHFLLLRNRSPLQMWCLDGRHERGHSHPSCERIDLDHIGVSAQKARSSDYEAEGGEKRYLARDAIGLALWFLGWPRLLLLGGREGGLREPEDVLRVHVYGHSRRASVKEIRVRVLVTPTATWQRWPRCFELARTGRRKQAKGYGSSRGLVGANSKPETAFPINPLRSNALKLKRWFAFVFNSFHANYYVLRTWK
jgi:hypothetical protein